MRYFISVISFIFIFSSCKDDPQSNLTVYRTAEEGLQRSNKSISTATNVLYHSLMEQTRDPDTRMFAEVWEPKALLVKKLSDSMINYIRGLKDELKNEVGDSGPDNEKKWENNLTVVNHVFESHGKGKELFERLVFYRQNILAVDPRLAKQFGNSTNIFTGGFNYVLKDTSEFTKTYFNNVPLIAAFVVLSKFENNVKICENEFVTFCSSQIPYNVMHLSTFSVLIGQSSNYLKVGDEIEINAGVGAYTTAARTRITMNGINIIVNENGMAIYRFKTPLKAGKYFVPVRIEYTADDGRKMNTTQDVSYTVKE